MPVVQRMISADQGLNLNPGFTTVQKPLLSHFPFFKACHYQIEDKKNYTGFSSKTFKFEIRSNTNPWLVQAQLWTTWPWTLGLQLDWVIVLHSWARCWTLMLVGGAVISSMRGEVRHWWAPAGWATCLEWRHFLIERCKCKLWLWLCVHLEQDTLLSEVVSFLRSMNRYWQTIRESWQISGVEETYNG